MRQPPEPAARSGDGCAARTVSGAAGRRTASDGGPTTTRSSALAPADTAAAGRTTAGPVAGPAAPAGSGGLPDPATAKTEIDWGKLLEDFGPPTRTVLEFGRLVPGWGLLAGLGADAINFASDLAAIPNSQNAELTTNLVMFRNGVNIVNNGVGRVRYINQLITDGLAGSVVGVEFAPLSMAANEFVSGAKVALDGVVMATDVFVEVEALYRADHAPTSDEAEKWRLLADGYQANQLGDVVNIVLDVMSLASAGAAQTGIINEVRLPLTAGGAFLKNAGPNIIGALNNIIGVWLGGLVTAGRHDPLVRGHAATVTLAKDAVVLHLAGGFVDAEAVKARAAYDGIDAIIDVFAEYADQQIADLDAVVASIGDGRSTFEVIRDAVQSGLDDMTAEIALLQRLTAGATDARMNADVITATCAGLLAQLDGITVPRTPCRRSSSATGCLPMRRRAWRTSQAGSRTRRCGSRSARSRSPSTSRRMRSEARSNRSEARRSASGSGLRSSPSRATPWPRWCEGTSRRSAPVSPGAKGPKTCWT